MMERNTRVLLLGLHNCGQICICRVSRAPFTQDEDPMQYLYPAQAACDFKISEAHNDVRSVRAAWPPLTSNPRQ